MFERVREGTTGAFWLPRICRKVLDDNVTDWDSIVCKTASFQPSQGIPVKKLVLSEISRSKRANKTLNPAIVHIHSLHAQSPENTFTVDKLYPSD